MLLELTIRNIALIESLPDAEALWITHDGTQYASSGFASFLTEP